MFFYTLVSRQSKYLSGLPTGQTREEAFRKAYYAERENRIQREAQLDAKIDSMDEKLDKVVEFGHDGPSSICGFGVSHSYPKGFLHEGRTVCEARQANRPA